MNLPVGLSELWSRLNTLHAWEVLGWWLMCNRSWDYSPFFLRIYFFIIIKLFYNILFIMIKIIWFFWLSTFFSIFFIIISYLIKLILLITYYKHLNNINFPLSPISHGIECFTLCHHLQNNWFGTLK